ncbi:hypothetical protein ACCI51_01900 [Microbulbifer echini]|uniref:Uncharacterized protein n=1 Tax=Microbulbifer echini TaxID=1529067 RepID=A0ABV4NIN8_9GAMM
MSDVNLDSVKFSVDGRDICLSFLDMYELQPLADIQCKSVSMFNMQNTFEEDEGFACYIGEVNCETVDRESLGSWLKENKFGFSGGNGKTYLPGEGDLKILSLYSGEITIEILCKDVISTNKD